MLIEMITEADWKRREKGLPPIPKPEIVIPEPSLPEVPNQIYFKDLFSEDKEITDVQGHLQTKKNKDGTIFIGFDISVGFRDKDGNSSSVSGWIRDCDFQKLKLYLRGSKVKTGIDLILG